jgi:phosphate transport system substrate-binding protein
MLRNQLAPMALVAAALSLTLVANGCDSSSNAEPTSTLTNVIGGVGSTFVDPLMKRWVLGFQQTHPQLGVNYRADGSGAGIAEFKKSMTEFAASDAPFGDDELKAMPAVLQVPVTAGPVCIIYNLPQIKAALKLDGKTLADIYLGRIVTWNDPAIARSNPGVSLRSLSSIGLTAAARPAS